MYYYLINYNLFIIKNFIYTVCFEIIIENDKCIENNNKNYSPDD
jgi:hypothetical protein